jgi:hypothetical protein
MSEAFAASAISQRRQVLQVPTPGDERGAPSIAEEQCL